MTPDKREALDVEWLARAMDRLPPGPYSIEGPDKQGGGVLIWGRGGTWPDFADGWAIPLVARGIHGPTEALADILNALWAALRSDAGEREG